MKKKRITYGVTGMMEYQAVIKVGRGQMKVMFTDGSATGYGTNPAMYTTENLMMQKAIENSEQFKSGRIHIVNSTDLDEEVHIISNPKPKDEELPELPDNNVEGKTEGETPAEDEAVEPEEEAGDEATPAEPKPLLEMEFDNNDDAKDYLEREFGYIRSKLRNRADIIAAGEINGVAISFS